MKEREKEGVEYKRETRYFVLITWLSASLTRELLMGTCVPNDVPIGDSPGGLMSHPHLYHVALQRTISSSRAFSQQQYIDIYTV